MNWQLEYCNKFVKIIDESKDPLQFKWKLLELIKTIPPLPPKCENCESEKQYCFKCGSKTISEMEGIHKRLEKLEQHEKVELITIPSDVVKRLEKLERWRNMCRND